MPRSASYFDFQMAVGSPMVTSWGPEVSTAGVGLDLGDALSGFPDNKHQVPREVGIDGHD